MSSDYSDKIDLFDCLFTSNHFQMLKILLPYTDERFQKELAIYIKYGELMYTIRFLSENPNALHRNETYQNANQKELCSSLLPFCSEREKAQMEQFFQIFDTMEQFSSMQEYMNSISDILPEGMDLSDLFSSML